MKKNYFKLTTALFCLAFYFFGSSTYAAGTKLDAKDLVERAESQTLGKTFSGHLTMTISGGGTPRKLEMRMWSIRNQSSLLKIISPAKDRDVGYLRKETNLWQYLPNVERIIKIPTSMMLQSWMGSDFSNDDLVKLSSLSSDYTHAILEKKKLGNTETVKIACTPKKDAPVVWGKVILWVRAGDAVPIKQEFYSENGELLKMMEGSEIKTFGDHTLATRLKITTLKKKSSTEIIYRDLVFDKEISPKLFTQENLKKPL